MIETDLQPPAANLRRQIDAAHRRRTERRYARPHWVQTIAGVGEAIGIVILFIACGLAFAAVLNGCSERSDYCEALGGDSFDEMQAEGPPGSGSVTTRALSEHWREGR